MEKEETAKGGEVTRESVVAGLGEREGGPLITLCSKIAG